MALPVDRILELIERQGTISQVSNYLRSHGLTYSAGSWTDLLQKRLRPAIADGSLSHSNLLALLGQLEEYGHQHIFLFRLRPSLPQPSIFSPSALQALVSKTHPHLQVNVASFEDMPSQPKLIEVRTGTFEGHSHVVFKFVERRTEAFNPVRSEEDGHLVVRYEQTDFRAVNTARVWDNGLVEIRIFSQSDAISYSGLAAAVWSNLQNFVQEASYSMLRLSNVRKALLDPARREEINRKYSLKSSNLKNQTGNRIQASTGSVSASMLDDETLIASVDEFNTEASGSYVDRASFSVRASGSEEAISRDIALVLHGDANEFTITSRITEREYEHILHSILSLADG